MSFATTCALGHVAKRCYAGGRTFSTQVLRETYEGLPGEAKGLQTRCLPDMQAKARTLGENGDAHLFRKGVRPLFLL